VTGRPLAVLAALALGLASGCSQEEQLGPEAQRGRQVYQAQCIACHSPDPAQAGPLGPPLRGASEALLRAKVLEGTYPPGYTPKRPTKVMQPMPHLASDIPALAGYLR
jgi:mono/diheme cytochrome c family protein